MADNWWEAAPLADAPSKPQTQAAPSDQWWENAPLADQPSVAADVAKTIVPSLAKGAIGVAASPVDIPASINEGVKWVGKKLGLEPDGPRLMPHGMAEALDALRSEGVRGSNPNAPNFLAPKIQSAVENVTGKFYEPQTTAGKFVGAGLENVPGTLLMPGGKLANALRYGVIPGMTGEAAAELAPNTGPARLVGTLAGVLGGNALTNLPGRAISPLPIPAERQGLVNTLTNEGVPLTAGQATGSRPLRYMESHLGDLPGSGGAAATMEDTQRRAFTQAALQRAGINSDLATTDAMTAGRDALSHQFNDLAARNTLRMDPQFATDIGNAVHDYVGLVPPSQRAPAVTKYVGDLVNTAGSGAQIEGPAYNAMRSDLARMAESTRMSDPPTSQAFRNLRNALDNAMGRSVSPEDATAWQEARRQWGNLKDLNKAAAAAGENAAQGYISPAQLRTAVGSGNNRGRYARGEGDLAELARAGVGVMSPLPNSGTPARLAVHSMMAAPGAVGGALLGGTPGAAAGAALAPFIPGLAGRLIMSRPVQAYLRNQIAPNLGMISQLDPRARALAATLALRPHLSSSGQESP